MTFMYESDPYPLEIYQMGKKWTSYIKAIESYRITDRQTDATEIIYHAASAVVNKRSSAITTFIEVLHMKLHASHCV